MQCWWCTKCVCVRYEGQAQFVSGTIFLPFCATDFFHTHTTVLRQRFLHCLIWNGGLVVVVHTTTIAYHTIAIETALQYMYILH